MSEPNSLLPIPASQVRAMTAAVEQYEGQLTATAAQYLAARGIDQATAATFLAGDAERFLSKVEFTESCWLWTAAVEKDGYGRFYAQGRYPRAHRFLYERVMGEVPRGLQLDHLCRVRRCVNPAHLEPVTCGVNVRRGKLAETNRERGRKQTHCKRGHERNDTNTRVTSAGRRECKVCRRMQARGEP